MCNADHVPIEIRSYSLIANPLLIRSISLISIIIYNNAKIIAT